MVISRRLETPPSTSLCVLRAKHTDQIWMFFWLLLVGRRALQTRHYPSINILPSLQSLMKTLQLICNPRVTRDNTGVCSSGFRFNLGLLTHKPRTPPNETTTTQYHDLLFDEVVMYGKSVNIMVFINCLELESSTVSSGGEAYPMLWPSERMHEMHLVACPFQLHYQSFSCWLARSNIDWSNFCWQIQL